MDTLFSLVDAVLYAHLVELKDAGDGLLKGKVRMDVVEHIVDRGHRGAHELNAAKVVLSVCMCEYVWSCACFSDLEVLLKELGVN